MKFPFILSLFYLLIVVVCHVSAVQYTVPNFYESHSWYLPVNCSANSSRVGEGSVVKFGYIGSLLSAGSEYYPRLSPHRRYTMIEREITIGSLRSSQLGFRSSDLGSGGVPNSAFEFGLTGSCIGEIRHIILPPRLVFDKRRVDLIKLGNMMIWEVEVMVIDGLTW